MNNQPVRPQQQQQNITALTQQLQNQQLAPTSDFDIESWIELYMYDINEEHNSDYDSAISLDQEYKSLIENEVPQHSDKKSAEFAENCDENSAIHLAPAATEENMEFQLQLEPLEVQHQEVSRSILGEVSEIYAESPSKTVWNNKIIPNDALPTPPSLLQNNIRTEEVFSAEIGKREADDTLRKASNPWDSPIIAIDEINEDKRTRINYR